MPVTATSKDCFYGQTKRLEHQEAEVLQVIRFHGEICCADIAAYLGIDRSSVSGRINALKAEDRKGGALIVFVEKRKSESTNVEGNHYRVLTEAEIEANRRAKELRKHYFEKVLQMQNLWL